MHEMSLVRPMVDAVLEACEGRGVVAVRSVRVSIGEMMDVVEGYVSDLFRFLARGTVAEGAEVVIERVPARVRCNACGDIFPIDARNRATCACPRCGERSYRLFTGREFRIDAIEVEERGAA